MKTKAELEEDIINITLKIQGKYPELTKFITEIPGKNTGTNSDEIDTKNLKDYYNSLEDLVSKYAKTHKAKKIEEEAENEQFPGYPHYPPSEDIYNQGKIETAIDPNDLSKKKAPNEEVNTRNEKDFNEDMSGADLDVPGSELDDAMEKVGSEDEENNYYSIGGDNHNDLDEDKG